MRIQREQVVAAAWALLDEAGLEGLTMRVLAKALSIQAPSLYWHFPGKQALLDAMADTLLQDVARTLTADSPWETVVRTLAGDLRRAFLQHRDGARVYAGTFVVSEHTLRVSDTLIGSLGGAGLGPRDAGWATFTVLDYVLGFTIEEQGFTAQASETTERAGALRELASARYPHAAGALDAILDRDFDRRFDFGLDLLVAGLRARMQAA
ncbi:TetR/AcrR family transcriptional regulator C-terminal domain-containing protein [Corallococcus sp. bb12-1]|uniref:TetR/AcrR family transcriptional regulator C-terminal domain-containing protein n=1 Tax=Corallococcus sp. bb12-1 TaxID=2996784 RepID=UPI002270BF01|nr:TetR/AcrR family transcriptional regulator C-terminal domain-containing protein [Corallococcus sp. bb12-1]MCY1042302.1 TetR/AcrR family transcriptional regulator C-terminal domain-containing protein [Corallococcus sp. bb12-1]